MKNPLATWSVALLAALLLAGCAARTAPPLALPVPALEQIDRWELQGKIGLRSDGKGGTATLVWRRLGDVHLIRLFGPLGGGRVIIEQNEYGAVLRDGGDSNWQGGSAGEVLYQRAGWYLPFEELTRWVVGLPADGEPYQDQRDAEGRLVLLTQSGWRVQYLAYDESAPPGLPLRMHLVALPETIGDLVHVKSGKPLGSLEVRLVIKRWDLRPPDA